MKWLIEKEADLETGPEEEKWTQIHQDGYHIWSMSADASVQQKIAAAIESIRHEDILLVGCGSVVDLQLMLVRRFADIRQIVCIDFEPVIKLAAQKGTDEKISYQAKDARDMGYHCCFDVVINVNSILCSADADNRRILSSCNQALKEGGSLIGFFPTVFCQEEVLSLEKRYNRFKRAWAKRKGGPAFPHTLLSPEHDILDLMAEHGQLYYTPLYLRMLLRQAGFEIDTFALFFCESEGFREQARKMHGITDEDVLIYEFFLHAKKRAKET